MSVHLAKTAGFCFGVSRAVELVEQAVTAGKTVATLGPIIHNRHAVDRFAKMGVRVIETPEEAKAGETVVIIIPVSPTFIVAFSVDKDMSPIRNSSIEIFATSTRSTLGFSICVIALLI